MTSPRREDSTERHAPLDRLRPPARSRCAGRASPGAPARPGGGGVEPGFPSSASPSAGRPSLRRRRSAAPGPRGSARPRPVSARREAGCHSAVCAARGRCPAAAGGDGGAAAGSGAAAAHPRGSRGCGGGSAGSRRAPQRERGGKRGASNEFQQRAAEEAPLPYLTLTTLKMLLAKGGRGGQRGM